MEILEKLSRELNVAVEAAQRAGEIVQTAFQTRMTVESKGEKGLVTEFDKKAEEVIIETLQSKTSYSIMGEESGLSDHQTEAIWVVDPIDGTTNFSRGLPFFAVSIALLQGNETKVGVIFNTSTNELFFAERGQGAYCNGRNIQVSTYRDPARAIVCLDRGYAKEDVERMATILSRLDRNYNVRIFGTTAFELTTLARGATDAFICSGDELWDYVAGVLLVEEAGGRFTDWRGEPWNRSHSFIFASNGHLHELLLAEISDLQVNVT